MFLKKSYYRKIVNFGKSKHYSNSHVAAITDVDSSINYIFSKFEQFRKNGKIKSDVKIKMILIIFEIVF